MLLRFAPGLHRALVAKSCFGSDLRRAMSLNCIVCGLVKAPAEGPLTEGPLTWHLTEGPLKNLPGIPGTLSQVVCSWEEGYMLGVSEDVNHAEASAIF